MIGALRARLVASAAVALFVFLSFFLLHPNTLAKLPRFSSSSSSSSRTSQSSSSQSSTAGDDKPYGRGYKGHSDPNDINRVANDTLGFGKVFVVGLPERTDKRDAIALTSSLTGFDVEWVDGVRGEKIPDSAVPFGVDRAALMDANLGSWRGHMNAIRRIVEENLDSALIMNDDVDWDVRLKPQLELTAAGARAVLDSLPETFFPYGRPSSSSSSAASDLPPTSPYGDDWDILWLGHCGEPFPEDLPENKDLPDSDPAFAAMARKWTILNDITVPPLNHVTGLVDFSGHEEHTRWIHVTAAPMCSFAYAVSQRGAQKILYDLSVNRLSGPFDNALASLCRRAVGAWSPLAALAEGGDPTDREGTLGDRGLDAKCISITPPLFFQHKAKGEAVMEGNAQREGEEDKAGDQKAPEIRDKGVTENIVWSARLNVLNMIKGTAMENQW